MASGALGGPEEIRTAWQLLAAGAPTAANALIDIADHGKSEVARVQASTAILDRVGLATPKERPSVQFNVIPKNFDEVGIGAQQLDPAEVIRSRLKELAAAQPSPAAAGPVGVPWETDDSEPVEAELVPDGDDDWSPNPWA
jgi:hypothetical protein